MFLLVAVVAAAADVFVFLKEVDVSDRDARLHKEPSA
jgi:hypothetical protein